MKTRTVTRTWMLKSGETRTKTYTYDYTGRSRKGKTLVSASGALNYTNIKEFKQQILSNKDYREDQKRSLINDLETKIKEKKRHKSKLTTTGFLGYKVGRAEGEDADVASIKRLLTNAGYSVEEAAEELGVTEEDILNTNNWKGDKFSHGSKTWQFTFTYTGSMFKLL